jgi:hypothetical protein
LAEKVVLRNLVSFKSAAGEPFRWASGQLKNQKNILAGSVFSLLFLF